MKKTFELHTLDLGSSNFTLLSMIRKNKETLMRTFRVPSEGFRSGLLVDFDKAKTALLKLIDQAELSCNEQISKVVLTVFGTVETRTHQDAHALQKKVISFKLIQELRQKTLETIASSHREILHLLPLRYRVDERHSTINPVGFSGEKLLTDSMVFDCDRYYLLDLVRLANQCGLSVEMFASGVYASTQGLFPKESLPTQFVVVDIGAETSKGLTFIGGCPSHSFSFPLGGKHFSKDLSFAFKIPFSEAERLKFLFGLSPLEHQKLDIIGYDHNIETISLEESQAILCARADELADLLTKALGSQKRLFTEGVYLVGGGASLRGLPLFLTKKLGLPIASAQPILQLEEEAPPQFGGQFSAVVGAMNLGMEKRKQEIHPKPSYLSNILSHFRSP